MKKLLVLLMVLGLAAPTMALTVFAVDEGSGVVSLKYTMANGEQRVRAFGLDVTVASPATIAVKPGSFKTGVSTGSSRGYGIFPGTIDINSTTGAVNGYGGPAAAVGSPGALSGNGVTVEIGSLYSPSGQDANAPVVAAGGTITLCQFQVTQNGATSPVALSLALNATRGGIVLEDANAAVSPTLTGTNVAFGVPPCFAGTPTEVTNWNAWGQPANWCGTCFRNGDITGDHLVTFGDVSTVLTYFKNGDTTGRGDFNMDHLVTFGDVSAVLTKFKTGATCP